MNRHFTVKEVQMAKKHMKRCLVSLPTREIQIKSTVRFHYIPIRMAIIKETEYQLLVRKQSNKNSHSLTVRMQNSSHFEDFLAMSYKAYYRSSHVTQQSHC